MVFSSFSKVLNGAVVTSHACHMTSQVRIHVLEARKLVGAGINPVVKVACGKEIKGTGSRKGTNNPFFNEVKNLEGSSEGG